MLILSETEVQSLIDIDEPIAVLDEICSLAFQFRGLELTQDSRHKTRDRAEAR